MRRGDIESMFFLFICLLGIEVYPDIVPIVVCADKTEPLIPMTEARRGIETV